MNGRVLYLRSDGLGLGNYNFVANCSMFDGSSEEYRN